MKNKLINPILTFSVIFLLTSCSKNNETYFPLTEGYKWRYDVTQITRDGLEKQKYFFNNLGKSRLDDESVYIRQSIDGTALYYSISEEGIVYLGNTDNQSIGQKFKEDRQIVIHNPVSVDTQWQQFTTTRLLKKTGPPQKTVLRIIAEVPMEVKIESMDAEVTVPAGNFKQCMKISMNGSTFKDAGNYVGLTLVNVKQTSWYAKGIGLVKMERLETTQSEALDRGSLLVELVEFDKG
ncbi:MAG: hypothetical protein MI865_09525 [Proteobacteria bacterium]|nr:hypothetical protein [Pseudomonadota bacterium]